MFDLVEKRLESIGYVFADFDETLMSYLVDTVVSEFLIDANIPDVPQEVKPILADVVFGKFLQLKRASNQLDINTLDFSGVTSVSMGDTSVNFGNNANDTATRFDTFITSLLNMSKGVSACYRRIKW